MNSEFQRLEKFGWELPNLNSLGLFTPRDVDESKISFPGESYDSAKTNDEAGGFWAMERASMIAKMLESNEVDTLWEIGAGNGLAAIPLRDQGLQIIPIEPLQSGAVTLAKNGFPTFHSTLEDLNLPSNSIGAFGAFDVLEHLEDPEILLQEINRVLKPGGIFICSVPAYQWLFSDFDEAIGHYRRYTQKSLKTLLESNSFNQSDSFYLFGMLVLPALLFRRIPYLLGRRRKFDSIFKSNKKSNYFVNKVFSTLRLTSKVARKFRCRFGLSIVATFYKP